MTAQELEQELRRRCVGSRKVEDLLVGILYNRLGRVLCQSVGLRLVQSVDRMSDDQIRELTQAVTAFEVELTEPLGMDSAQVTAGGVRTDGFDPETMESRLVPGLYACGEVLDVDGDCGGYNLQWAWSSGRSAGASAGKRM
jgi:predicted Rossmann fold flavoprotein